MSNRTRFSHQEIGALRDKASEYLGKRVILDNLTIPSVSNSIPSIRLHTHGKIMLVTSEVELYPYLKQGGKYERAFGETREPESVFAFQMQAGLPAVSIVLPEQRDAITVIKKLITEDGAELAWSAVLEEIGVHRLQFRGFIEVADGILLNRSGAPIRLEGMKGIQLDSTLKEQPKPDVPNLDSVMQLTPDAKRILKMLLPSLLAAEKAE